MHLSRIVSVGLGCLLYGVTPIVADGRNEAEDGPHVESRHNLAHDDHVAQGENEVDESPDESHRQDFDVLETGFVFVDGEYLPPPYQVSESDDGKSVLINGTLLPGISNESRRGKSFGRWPGWGGRSGSGRNSFSGHPGSPSSGLRQNSARRVHNHLQSDENSIVVFSERRPEYLEPSQTYWLLRSLLERNPRSREFQQLLSVPLTPDAIAIWSDWITEFKLPADLKRRADEYLEMYEETLASNEAIGKAVRRYDAVAYPLTILGMVIGVIALGHLLMSAPNQQAMRSESGVSSEIVRATLISLGLIAALSCLDLIWTILAAQAGQMRELNPIGGHLINDPQMLVLFKLVATLIGCGLLFALRRHGRAQLASWWMCLVCTVLTFRWVMFTSMFVA